MAIDESTLTQRISEFDQSKASKQAEAANIEAGMAGLKESAESAIAEINRRFSDGQRDSLKNLPRYPIDFLNYAQEALPGFREQFPDGNEFEFFTFGKADGGVIINQVWGGMWDERMPESQFKRIFPSLVEALEKDGKITAAAKMASHYVEFRNMRPKWGGRHYGLDWAGEIPSVRLITKEEQGMLKAALEARVEQLNATFIGKKAEIAAAERRKNGVEAEIQEISQSRGYLALVGNANQGSRACIRNGSSDIFHRGKMNYSIFLGNSPVLFCADGVLYFLSTTRKDSPLEIGVVPQAIASTIADRLEVAKKCAGLQPGDFVTRDATLLIGHNESYAADLYQKVFQGKRILPRPNTAQGYHIPASKRGQPLPDKYRHWGQLYLSTLDPKNVVQGHVLGSGGSYKAFIYGNGDGGEMVVVEFDQEDRATYLFNGSFDALRTKPRSEIISQKPAGFGGRVIHHQDRDAWRAKVRAFLGK